MGILHHLREDPCRRTSSLPSIPRRALGRAHNPKLGRAILRKDLYTDPETGAEIRLVRYPAGW